MANDSLDLAPDESSLKSEPMSQAATALWLVVPPLLLVCGIFGNVMTIVVMQGLKGGQTTACVSVYFTALAVSDLMTLILGLPIEFMSYYLQLDLLTWNNAVCKLWSFLQYTSGLSSAWILVAMTLQRAISVVWPLKISLQGSRRKAVLIISVIVCFSLIFYSGILVDFSLVEVNGVRECYIASNDSLYKYAPILHWSDLTLSSIVPFVVLSASNSLLLWKVTQSVRTARTLNLGHVHSRVKTASSLSVTVIITSAAFLIMTLPLSVFAIYPGHYVITVSEEAHMLGLVVSTMLWYCNSAINFYLYCLSGVKFRTVAKGKLKLLLQKCYP